MKLIHLSDLHIGKRVYEFSLIEDQKYILNQILQIIENENADGVILAGDIYDKTVPSAEAVQVLDRFLSSLGEMKIPVFMIHGNHDSAERLSFGASLMKEQGIYISPVYDGTIRKITLTDEYGDTAIYLLPFLKPAMVKHALNLEESPESANAAIRMVIDQLEIDPSIRNILVAHQFVTGARSCESEEVQAGGLDQIEMENFALFDYVALGHIHSPQKVGRETVRYCGTPLKYSFSEAEQEKTVTVIELKEKGDLQLRTIPLKPIRDMRKLRGTYLEVTNRSFYEGTNTRDYIQITLTDEEDIPDGLEKLRIIYPNLMHLEYDNRRTRENQNILVSENGERKSEIELFEEFYELQNNQPMNEAQKAFCLELLEELKTRR